MREVINFEKLLKTISVKKCLAILLVSIFPQYFFAQPPPVGMNFGLKVQTQYSDIDSNYSTGNLKGTVLGGRFITTGVYKSDNVHLFEGVQWGTGDLASTAFDNPGPNVMSQPADLSALFKKTGTGSLAIFNYDFNVGTLKAGKYNFRAFVYVVINRSPGHDMYTYYGNIVSMEVPENDGSLQINNNVISTGNVVTCNTNSITLIGAKPTGGLNGAYTYSWQTSNNAQNWSNIAAADSQNYTITAVSKPASNTRVYYRRIVVSGKRSDTSAQVCITYLSSSPPYKVRLKKTVQNDRSSWGPGHSDIHQILLTAVPDSIFGDFLVKWQASVDNVKFTNENSTGAHLDVTPMVKTAYMANIYYQTQTNCNVTSDTLRILAVQDVDQNIYETVKIGTQTWLNPNLLATRFNDSTIINNLTGPTQWTNTTSPAWCQYGNNPNQFYGNLYNWYVITNTKNVCPVGWHVPTTSDWNTLNTITGGAAFSGGELKITSSASTSIWQNPNIGPNTNPYGFSAYPAGYCTSSFSFMYAGSYTYWWEIGGSSQILNRAVMNTSQTLFSDDISNLASNKNTGCSIRCVK